MKTINTQIDLYENFIRLVLCLLFIFISVSWGWSEREPDDGRCWVCSENLTPRCGTCPVLTEETVFTGLGATVMTGESCTEIDFYIECGSECDYLEDEGAPEEEEDCEFYKASLPGFRGSSASIDWGMQGANVVVSSCGIFPAKGTITIDNHSEPSLVVHRQERQCSDVAGVPPVVARFFGSRYDSHYFMAVFDPNVFIVNGSSVSPVMVSGGITVELVGSDCDTLNLALGATVEIYHRKLQTAYIHMWDCTEEGEEEEYTAPRKSELTTATLFATVGVEFIPSDYLDCECPGSAGAPASCSSGGCTGSCPLSTSSGGFSSMSVGSASASAASSMSGTLSVFGSPAISMGYSSGTYGTPEINAPGGWIHATNYPYKASNVAYTATESAGGDAITKIDYLFNVDVSSGNTNYYEFHMRGNWEDDLASGKLKEQVALEAFLEAARGKVQLTHVTNPDNDTILDFVYDISGKVKTQISYDESSTPNGYVKYDYFGESLKRIWVGTDMSDYNAYPTSPSGGRWITVTYGADGYLDDIEYSGCSSCRAAREYERGGPDGDQLTKIKKKSDGTVLETYDYDSRGRFESYTIGDGADELTVNEWIHSDYDPADHEGTSGDNMLVRKDFVNNTQYRAKIFFANDNDSLIKEIHYHQLQDDTDEWLHGSYSVYRYYYKNNEIDGLRYYKQYPKGNKLVKYFDANKNVIKVQWDGASKPETEYEFQEYYYGSDTQYLVREETNAYGGITSYTYDGFDVLTRTSPSPGAGISGSGQQVVAYVYDNNNRIDYEYQKASNGTNVYTKYVYDFTGNLKKKLENCLDYTSTTPTEGLITEYDYSEYNELIKTTYPSGKVHRNFYSDSGTKVAEAVYDNDATNSAASATIYEYEDGKLTTKKIAKMDTSFTFTETDIPTGGSITWVSESYEYDDYGRREAVISDETGEAVRTAEFEYNNLGEVIKVLKSDKRYIKTIRDGRGLVVQEITGVEISGVENDKATTQYFYDLNDNLIKKVDPEGVTEIYQYNFKDRMTKSRKGK